MLARQECISLDSPAEWNAALTGIQHAFAHTWENCNAMHLTTGFKTYLYTFALENTRIVCPISERHFEGCTNIVTPYGFSGFVGNGDCFEFRDHWKTFIKDRGYVCGYIALNPLFENSTYFEPHEAYHSNSLYYMDIRPSIDEIFAKLDRNRKRQLKHWEQTGIPFIFDKCSLKKFFLSNYHDFLRRIDASPSYYFSNETLACLCNSGNVFMIGAGERGRIDAVYIFAHTPHLGECLFNVASPEGRKFATPLLWAGIKYLKSIQVPFLNLGGGIREGDSVAQSKERLGAHRYAFRSLKQVYDQAGYERLCRRVNADSNDRMGYFPPWAQPSRSSLLSGQRRPINNVHKVSSLL